MILFLLGLALAADPGDTSSCGGMLVPGATYNRATYMCECTAIDEFCAEYFGGTCPTWSEVSAGGWDNADCGAGSTLEHVASQETNEWGTILGFDGTGVLVWAQEWHGRGGLWCCEGVASDSIVWGVPATCLPVSGDTAGNGGWRSPQVDAMRVLRSGTWIVRVFHRHGARGGGVAARPRADEGRRRVPCRPQMTYSEPPRQARGRNRAIETSCERLACSSSSASPPRRPLSRGYALLVRPLKPPLRPRLQRRRPLRPRLQRRRPQRPRLRPTSVGA